MFFQNIVLCTVPPSQMEAKPFFLTVVHWFVHQLCEAYHRGADLLVTDQYGMTALHHSARFGHKNVVKFMIDNGKWQAVTTMKTLLLRVFNVDKTKQCAHFWHFPNSIFAMEEAF